MYASATVTASHGSALPCTACSPSPESVNARAAPSVARQKNPPYPAPARPFVAGLVTLGWPAR